MIIFVTVDIHFLKKYLKMQLIQESVRKNLTVTLLEQ